MIGIFLDTETNGLNFYKHRILEIAIVLLDLKTGKVLDTLDCIVSQSPEIWDQSDPNSLKVNGFTFDMLKGGKSEHQVAREIIEMFDRHGIIRGKAVYICQNPSFDRIYFSQLIPPETQESKLWPYHWLDLASMHWALSIRKHKEKESSSLPWEIGLSKDRIAGYYKIGPESSPHRAINGVNHLIECYKKVVGVLT